MNLCHKKSPADRNSCLSRDFFAVFEYYFDRSVKTFYNRTSIQTEMPGSHWIHIHVTETFWDGGKDGKRKISNLYDLDETIAKEYLEQFTYPWEALKGISEFIKKLGPTLDPEKFEKRGEDIWVAKSAKVAPTACLNGLLIIDEDAEIRHCAFVRGSAIVGKGSVVGNSTELKNDIIFNSVQVPHYNYVGDSILGYKSHMGAGSITSNVKSDKTLVVVKDGDEKIETGLKKFGAMLGDFVEIGCNSVLNPGTVIGRHTNVYPLSSVRGVIPANSIFKKPGEVVQKKEA